MFQIASNLSLPFDTLCPSGDTPYGLALDFSKNAIYSHRSYSIKIFVSCLYTTMYEDTL